MTFKLLSFLAFSIAVLAQQAPVLFVDSEPDQEWAGSVVDQDACGTTLDIVCTAGTANLPVGYGTISCDPSGFESNFASAAVTYSGNSIYEVSQSYQVLRNGGIKIQVTETCSLYGSSSAVCSADVSGSTAGIETLIPTVTTYGPSEASQKFFQVPITGGTITAGNATCPTPAPFTTPSPDITPDAVSTASRAVESAAVAARPEVRKVIVVPGAAALLAAAGLL